MNYLVYDFSAVCFRQRFFDISSRAMPRLLAGDLSTQSLCPSDDILSNYSDLYARNLGSYERYLLSWLMRERKIRICWGDFKEKCEAEDLKISSGIKVLLIKIYEKIVH